MAASPDAPGPAALRALRYEAGLSQEELAERAGLGVRTVRDLEAGRVRVPQRHSLLSLTRALALQPEHADAFVSSWTSTRRSRTFTELVGAGENVDTLLADHSDEFVNVFLYQLVTLGSDRRVATVHNQVAMRALHTGIDRRLFVWRFDARYDIARLRMTHLHGCELADMTVLPEHGLAVFDFSLGHTLSAGQTHLYSYRVDLRDTHLVAEPAVEALYGSRRRINAQILEVDFSACGPPARILRVSGSPDRRVRGKQVEITGFGIAHAAFEGLDPGVYGLEWDWE